MVAIKNSSNKKMRKISWNAFLTKYLTKENGHKYEWLDGIIEKSQSGINKKYFFIIYNITRAFYNNFKFKGAIITGGDTFFGKHHRRPDIAYYTDQQIEDARQDLDAVPLFVIEIISSKDQMNKVHLKMKDYRNAGVKIIWHIFPELEEVHVYSNKATKMQVRRGKDSCSAESVIKGFKITVADIFKK